jgi:hypothetical protein
MHKPILLGRFENLLNALEIIDTLQASDLERNTSDMSPQGIPVTASMLPRLKVSLRE